MMTVEGIISIPSLAYIDENIEVNISTDDKDIQMICVTSNNNHKSM
jgi:hypothetical protein